MTIELLMIAPAEFAGALEPLRRHKARTGLPTEIVTLESVYASFPGRDEAERVKRCIASSVTTDGVHYVMLVGDSDRFPVRYTVTDRKDPKSFNTAFYSADLYYADLFEPDGSFETWDYTGDGYFGELHGESLSDLVNVDRVDLRPDVAVGRIPASTVAEVERYVAKVITYEFGAYGKPWPKRALLLAGDWPKGISCQTQEAVAASLKGYQVQRAYQPGSTCAPTPAPNATLVNTALAEGVGFVAYVGHGNDSAWFNVYGAGDLPGAGNADHPTVAFAMACDTAVYTTQPPYSAYTDVNGQHHTGSAHGQVFTSRPPQPACIQAADPVESMAEALLVGSANGAVGYVACVTGAQHWGADLLKFFAEALPGQFTTLGGAWNYMLLQYYQAHIVPVVISPPDWDKLAEVHQPWKFHLFGDPSLRLTGVSSIQKIDFLGTYEMDHDGWKGTLVLKAAPDAYIEQTQNIKGTYAASDGRVHEVRGHVRTWGNPLPAAWGPDHQIEFWIDFADTFQPDDDQRFLGYLTTGDHGAITGLTWWNGTPFGFHAVKRAPLVAAVDDLTRLRGVRVGLVPGDLVLTPIS
jgi:Peptidase family C25